ncbi:MAG: 1-deoxy-D-xylulose-5-phosphate reductoisomerase [Bacilli bacterium]|nr:1-deoxy-D-xylulose-5-phosphate reductoisomerase [Bacilli bacterium]
MKDVYLLGATGSIGKQTIEILRENKNAFSLKAVSCFSNIELLKKIIKEFKPKYACVGNIKDKEDLEKEFSDIICFSDEEGLLDLVTSGGDGGLLVNAIVGIAGLMPTVKAIEHKRDILLANKETLVTAGKIIKDLVKKNNVKLIPIDSEHSAIFQCLLNSKNEDVESIIITASGGSFRDKTREALESVTLEDALCHPNWSMGKKITIDSATMVNKGLEVIEAHYLFDISYDKIRTILHKESIIHSMVEFVDKSIIAQLGNPDMRIPIQYALFYPERKNFFNIKSLNFLEVKNLSFQELSFKRFPCLELAYFCGREEGIMPVVYNASNEAAVKLFLEKKIKFIEIEEIISKAVKSADNILNPSLDVILETDKLVKENIYNMYEVKR